MNSPLLVAKNVHKSIESHNGVINILKGIDLSIKPFQSVAIVGKSGSGKSTLLSLLAGLDVPQKGNIYMNGEDICALDEDQRAQIRSHKTGFVFQSFYLMEDLTAIENIALPLELFGFKDANKKALSWLQKLGLDNRA
jgi:putative ABC transport system ATP-binding protein